MDRIADRKAAEELVRSLVRIESPYFHEEKVMAFVLSWLREAGLPAAFRLTWQKRRIPISRL